MWTLGGHPLVDRHRSEQGQQYEDDGRQRRKGTGPKGALAFADIAVLLALIAATLVAFWRIRPLAGALLVPYLAWVAFASALNHAVWRLNPGVL